MTVKEIAEFTGKEERTVRRWVVKAADKMSSVADKMSSAGHGKVTDYNLDEVECILNASTMSRDAVSILMANARNNSSPHENVSPIVSDKSTSLTSRDIEIISTIVSMSVAKTFEILDKRVEKLESKVEERKALLPPPSISPRAHITQLARKYVSETGSEYHEAYAMLYSEYNYRMHENASLCAKNRGIKVIDYIEDEGNIEILESIAMELFSRAA